MRRNSTIELGYKCWWLDFTATQRAQVSDSHKEYINFGLFFFLIGDFQYHFGHAELKSSIQVVKVVCIS